MHLPQQSSRSVLRHALGATLGLFVLFAAGAVPVAAHDPDLFEHEATPSPQPTRPPARVTTPPHRPTPTPTPDPASPVGYDVSWPQCNDQLPESFAFAIVGVNRGRTFSQNHCLTEQLEWAGRDADFYLNTANPGPDISSFWPSGQDEPRSCDTDPQPGDDTHDCSYLYGWNAAADAYARVREAFIGLDWADTDDEFIPGAATWWLDVETANSWRGDRRLNVSSLWGAVDYLESMKVAEVGFYSTPLLWWRVTRSTDAFDGYPAWHAGARTEAQARDRCDNDAFTGGELRMVQWVEKGIDSNIVCETAAD